MLLLKIVNLNVFRNSGKWALLVPDKERKTNKKISVVCLLFDLSFQKVILHVSESTYIFYFCMSLYQAIALWPKKGPKWLNIGQYGKKGILVRYLQINPLKLSEIWQSLESLFLACFLWLVRAQKLHKCYKNELYEHKCDSSTQKDITLCPSFVTILLFFIE